MRPAVFALLGLPLLVVAQSSASPVVQLSTSIFVTVFDGSNNQPTTVVTTSVATITVAPAPSGSAVVSNSNSNSNSSASASGNSSASATGSANSTSSTSTTTTPVNLPTAPTDVDGGGNGPGGAPSPGASSAGGIFGPDDGFTAAAMAIKVNALLISAVGVAVGAFIVLN